MLLAPLALVAAAVAAAALMTAACWLAENGFPWHLVPDFSADNTPAALPVAPTAYLCPKTNRWRDAVTKKFVARPAV